MLNNELLISCVPCSPFFPLFLQTMLNRDIELPEEIPELLIEKHVSYLLSFGTKKDDYVRYCLCIYIFRIFFGYTHMMSILLYASNKNCFCIFENPIVILMLLRLICRSVTPTKSQCFS